MGIETISIVCEDQLLNFLIVNDNKKSPIQMSGEFEAVPLVCSQRDSRIVGLRVARAVRPHLVRVVKLTAQPRQHIPDEFDRLLRTVKTPRFILPIPIGRVG